jgi:hypothetical protein
MGADEFFNHLAPRYAAAFLIAWPHGRSKRHDSFAFGLKLTWCRATVRAVCCHKKNYEIIAAW